MTYLQAISEILFVMFMVMTALGAVLSVRGGLLMHSVLGLAVCMLGIAGLYYFLGSMFMTLMQMLIYVGAICVVLVFGMMVSYTPRELREKRIRGRHLALALAACAGVTGLLGSLVVTAGWTVSPSVPGGAIEPLGEMLLYNYCLAFELISVILLIAIVGSIILARGGHVTEPDAPEFPIEDH